MILDLRDFMTIKNEWRDQLLKEYAEQEFEDDGTMLEVNIDTGDDDDCCEMIKQKYSDTLNTQFRERGTRKSISMDQFDRYGIDCNKIKMQLEKNAYEQSGVPGHVPTDPVAMRTRMAKFKAIVDEWDRCEEQKGSSWKNELR